MVEKKIVDGILYSVAAIIFNNKNEVLMFDRKGEKWETGWEFIKGAIHVGETEEQTVLREIKEEAGLDNVEMIGKIPEDFWAEKPGKNGMIKIKGRIFVFKYIGGEIKLGEPEHVDYKWILWEEARDKVWIKDADKAIEKAYQIYSNLK